MVRKRSNVKALSFRLTRRSAHTKKKLYFSYTSISSATSDYNFLLLIVFRFFLCVRKLKLDKNVNVFVAPAFSPARWQSQWLSHTKHTAAQCTESRASVHSIKFCARADRRIIFLVVACISMIILRCTHSLADGRKMTRFYFAFGFIFENMILYLMIDTHRIGPINRFPIDNRVAVA